MNNIQQAFAAVVTETVAAVMAPSMDNNNPGHITTSTSTSTSTPTSTKPSPGIIIGSQSNSSSHYTYDISAAGLMYWSGDGGGGSESGLGIEGSGDVIINGIGNTIDYFNGTHVPYDLFYYPCPDIDITPNTTVLNVTCDNTFNYIIYGYCMPILLIITVLSNSLIVLILSKKKMSTPTNFVLMGMAICDMLTVIFPAPGFMYIFSLGNYNKPLSSAALCLTYSIINDIMPAMWHTASIWLTLALAVQRYIYVCHAPMARTWCTMPRVKRCTLYIVVAAFLYQSTRFFDRSYETVSIEFNGEIIEACNTITLPWVYFIGPDYYYSIYFLFRLLFVHLLPCIMLITLNILLFVAMRQAQERRKLLFRENRKKECKKLRESNCTTLMLIVVLTVFLIVEIPVCVVTALHIVSAGLIPIMDYEIANLCITLTNFFLVVSYPINFGIYCGMSRQFRETFKEIFLGNMMTKKDASSRYSMVNGPRTCTNTNETVL